MLTYHYVLKKSQYAKMHIYVQFSLHVYTEAYKIIAQVYLFQQVKHHIKGLYCIFGNGEIKETSRLELNPHFFKDSHR